MLEELGQRSVPVQRSWRLNERHYGALQGLNKAETAERFGEKQVLMWRRSYDVRPPASEREDERHPGHDPLYQKLDVCDLPLTECLKDTVERCLPYWHGCIVPALEAGQRVLIVAHGNSMRALVKYLDDVSDDEVLQLNIPTGIPLIYELDDQLRATRHYYLGDPEAVAKAIQGVSDQGKSR